MFNISVIGMGYIGLPTALLVADKKTNVNCIDIDKNKILNLKNNKIFLKEKSIKALFNKKKSFLHFSDKIIKADTYIICLPTPSKKISKFNYKEDLNILNKFLLKLEKVLKNGDLIIIESTCPPNTAKKYYRKIRKKINVHLSTCPERAIPGATIDEMTHNNRIIGASSKLAFNKTKKIYKKFVKGKIFEMSLIEAELVKLFENTYRDTNIALANEMDTICKNFGISSKKVIKHANLHPRVNIHKPGIGVGGHCLPVDPWFLLNKKKNHSLIFTSRAVNINKEDEIYSELSKNLYNKKILIFGTTYKENSDDIRNSSSLNIIKKILKKFPKVKVFDPWNKSYNNILKSEVLKNKFDLLVIFVNHKWLIKNKIKFVKKISF